MVGIRGWSCYIWDTRNLSGDPILLRGDLWLLAFSPDGNWLVTSGRRHHAVGYAEPSQRSNPLVLQNILLGARLQPRWKWLAAGNKDMAIYLWDIQNPTAEPIPLTDLQVR